MAYVLIIIVSTFYGPAIDSVPFGSAEACLAARDDLRKNSTVYVPHGATPYHRARFMAHSSPGAP